MTIHKPGVTTRSNRQAIDERGDGYRDQIQDRLEIMQQIADRLDSAEVVVSDVQLMRGLTDGAITLRVGELAQLLGIEAEREQGASE